MDFSGLGQGFLDFGASALSYLGTQDTNRTNRGIAKDTNIFNSLEAQKNRDFQEQMSNTAYQRSVLDMQQAGLNPMLLAAKGLGGASTPGGSTASGTTGAPMQNALGSSVATALDVLTTLNSARKTASDIKVNDATAINLSQDALVKAASAKKIGLDSEMVRNLIPGAKLRGDIDRSNLGKVLSYSDRILGTANSAVGLINPVRGMFSGFAKGGTSLFKMLKSSQYDPRSSSGRHPIYGSFK